MRKLVLALTAAALLAGCTGKDDPRPDPEVPLTAPTYLQTAASSDLFEIQSSELALQRSQNAAIRAFARMLIEDHTRMSNELRRTAAATTGLTAPAATLLPRHAALLSQLQHASRNFDVAYRDAQVASHQAALTLHRNYARSGDHASLRAVAARAAPVVEEHLSEAESLLRLLSRTDQPAAGNHLHRS
jgi:putative membrane protein